MFDAICKHLQYATNKGNVRCAITIFPGRTAKNRDFRVWNTQLIGYAGYEQPDGSVVGDPKNINFTKVRGKNITVDVILYCKVHVIKTILVFFKI